MLKQSELNPDEQAQVFARADALFREESEQAQNARSAARAAEELGVPQEYLDRAAAQFHAEKVEKVRAQNQRKRVLTSVGLAAIPATLAIFLTMSLLQRAAPPPPVVVAQVMAPPSVDLTKLDDATTLWRNGETGVSLDGPVKVIVKQFFADGNSYAANAGFSTNGSLRAYNKVSFNIKGSGISNVRVDLREGQTRWNSRQISLSPQGQRVTLNFDELNRQTQSGLEWNNERGGRPDDARAIVFKFGQGVNPVDTKGSAEISDVRFE